MRTTEYNKWQRMLVIYRYLQEKKGVPLTVGQVRTALLARSEDIGEVRDTQRDLLELRDACFIRSSGSGRNLCYKLTVKEGVAFQGRLDKQDLFSFLLWSKVQSELFPGGAPGMQAMERTLAHSAEIEVGLHGKNLFEDLRSRVGGLVEFVGEQSVRGPREDVAPLLLRALLENHKIHVTYEGIQDEAPRERTLEPWYLLVYKSELYFMCPDDKPKSRRLKYFKLARIASAKLAGEKFARDPVRLGKELDRLHEQGSLWQAHDEKSNVIRLAFPWGFQQILEERKPHPSLKVIEHSGKEPWVEARLHMPSGEDLLEWIRRWGCMVSVLSPKSLRTEMRNYGIWLLEEYPQ